MFIITGGGTGIGRALAHNLAERGQSVVIVGRREEPLVDTADNYPNFFYLSADVSTDEGRTAMVSFVKNASKIQGIVHNAGTVKPITSIKTIKPSEWRQTMSTNVEPSLFLTQSLYHKLAGGRVLSIGSGAAYFPVIGWAPYCVSKAALAMLTRCWQLEVDDVYFASVMPGIIDTDMQAYIREARNMDSEKQAFFKELKQEDKLISPETVASFLSWLLLDVDSSVYQSKEWDIYDESHHENWLTFPHSVPPLE